MLKCLLQIRQMFFEYDNNVSNQKDKMRETDIRVIIRRSETLSDSRKYSQMKLHTPPSLQANSLLSSKEFKK